MLPSRRTLDGAVSWTSCSSAPVHPYAQRRPGYPNRLCRHDRRDLSGRPVLSMVHRNPEWYRDRLNEERPYGCPVPESRSSCPVGPGVGRPRPVPVWGHPVHPVPDAGDAVLPEQMGGPPGDDAHPCPERRRTDCCPDEERRGGVPETEAWVAEWAAGSWPRAWGWQDWLPVPRGPSSRAPLEPVLPQVPVWAQPSSCGAWPGQPLPVLPVLPVPLEARGRVGASEPVVSQGPRAPAGQGEVWEPLPVWLAEQPQGRSRMQNVPSGVSPQGVRSSMRQNVRTHPSR